MAQGIFLIQWCIYHWSHSGLFAYWTSVHNCILSVQSCIVGSFRTQSSILSLKINVWSLTRKINDSNFADLTGLIQLQCAGLKQMHTFRRLVYFVAKPVSGTCTVWILLYFAQSWIIFTPLALIISGGHIILVKKKQYKYLQTRYSSVQEFQLLKLWISA